MDLNHVEFPRMNSARALTDSLLRLYACDDLSVIGKLGSGFFANVYLVYHHPTKMKMAMKLSNETIMQRREIELLKTLRHENIQRLHGVCIIGGRLACLTEFANGGSLVHLLSSTSCLPWICRISIAHDIICGLGYLHERKLIHRDLSSQNILIRVDEMEQRDEIPEQSSCVNPKLNNCPTKYQSLSTEFGKGEKTLRNSELRSDEDSSSWIGTDELNIYNNIHCESSPSLHTNLHHASNLVFPECQYSMPHLDSRPNNGGRETSNLHLKSTKLPSVMPVTACCFQQESFDWNNSEDNFYISRPFSQTMFRNSFVYSAVVGDLGLCLDLRRKNADPTINAGNPYCTAPECLKKVAPYSPAADVFSFGLLLCELITRLINDGSRIPRSSEFGLDVDNLKVPFDCPAWFLQLAVRCCHVDYRLRPSVQDIQKQLLSQIKELVNSSVTTIEAPSYPIKSEIELFVSPDARIYSLQNGMKDVCPSERLCVSYGTGCTQSLHSTSRLSPPQNDSVLPPISFSAKILSTQASTCVEVSDCKNQSGCSQSLQSVSVQSPPGVSIVCDKLFACQSSFQPKLSTTVSVDWKVDASDIACSDSNSLHGLYKNGSRLLP